MSSPAGPPTLAAPFVPPAPPLERLGTLRRIAEALPGGMVDATAGQPVDPAPEFIVNALTADPTAMLRYPAAIGSPELRKAAAAWYAEHLGVPVAPEAILACVGTKEFITSLPQYLHRRTPERDTVLFPAIGFTAYEMGAQLAGLRAVPVPLDADWQLELSAVSDDDASRALVLWVDNPANPTGAVTPPARLAATVAWARDRGVILACDECYFDFVPEPYTALATGLDGVLALHSLSKRSNIAGVRAGLVAGDPKLIDYLGVVRRHAGLLTPSPVQSAAIAALSDETHVSAQRDRYLARRAALLPALEAVGLVADGGPMPFYLWMRDANLDTPEDGWQLAARLAEAGLLCVPGDIFGAPGVDHVRISLTIPDDRVALTVQRLRDLSERR